MNKLSICTSREELELFVLAFFKLPPKMYHSAQLWHTYAGMLRNRDTVASISAKQRNTGKTLTAALLAGLAYNHFNRTCTYAGGTQAQYKTFIQHYDRLMIEIGLPIANRVSVTSLASHVPHTVPNDTIGIWDEPKQENYEFTRAEGDRCMISLDIGTMGF